MSILVANVQKSFNNRIIINDISLEVKDNELFVLLGGSGSGKSTLLRIIAGLLQADKGQIIIDGRDVTNLAPQDRDIGFVFQNYSVFRHMTVSENIEFGLKIRKVPSSERRKKSAELLDLVNLTGLGTRHPNQLSGGQLQRVALARALAYNPKVLLLDEPFGALDVKIRSQLRKSLKEIQNQLKVTMILVTHDQEEAFELANRIGVLDYGRLLEVGTSEALYHHPQKEFTATFIGGGNVLIGRKVGNQIKLGSTHLPFPHNAPAHDENVPLRVLFRPEMIQLQKKEITSDQKIYNLGNGTVKEVIFNGSLQRIILEVNELQGVQSLLPQPVYGQQATLIVAVKRSTTATEDQIKQGQRLCVGLKDYHVLNPSGLKILVYSDDSKDGLATAVYGLSLGKATGGAVTLLTVTDSPNAIADARERLEKIGQEARPHLTNLAAKVRTGNVAEEVINERFQEDYEVCIINKNTEELKSTTGNIWKQHVNFGIPVMLTQGNTYQLLHILICTAAGEPGKDDILFGARVAKLTGAKVTLLHVLRGKTSIIEQKRIERHLKLGEASLTAIGVPNSIKIAEHRSPVESIISEMETGNYDLLVVGAPAPTASQTIFWPNLTSQIINRTSWPILIVPMINK